MESESFIRSLTHTNSERPSFCIKPGTYPMLQISIGDQSMQVPMAEILNFARRWMLDHENQQKARAHFKGLSIFPYPLMGTKFDDPDCAEVRWDSEEAQ